MNKKNRIIMVLAVIAALIATTVIFAYLAFLSIRDIQANKALTEQLSPELFEQLKGKSMTDFPYMPAPINWKEKYLALDFGGITETKTHGIVNFSYNKKRNEKLKTDYLLTDKEVNGIVFVEIGFEIVGEYKSQRNANKLPRYANQPYYVLHFIDLKQQATLAQDTIWGGMPPKNISSGDNGGTGKLPEEAKVIETIKNRTGSN